MKIRSIVFDPLTFEEDGMSVVKWTIRYNNEKSFCTLTTNVVKAEFYLNTYGVLIHRFYIMDKTGEILFKTSSPDDCAEYLNNNKKKLIIDILAHLPELDDRTRELLKAVALYEEGGNNE